MITGTVIVTLINICQNVYDYVIYNHTLNITIFLDMQVLGLHSSLCMYTSVFDKLIWHTIGPNKLLIWHCTVLSLGQWCS